MEMSDNLIKKPHKHIPS